ncbi:hypothetical protein Misp01_68730 [Microtetraspora sp. NBRC 13810]|uniref:hypothetical protein n=1 Tax=Microtetraspora sp. NBRC 13810 TaxID=3030990 RepID=UPI0024A4DC5A|nr:hypothetical protein [Microtetraspora sp. NBRC 13810]GLW11745.1 hypothetical protein Misp01_68730 [Microtetraspora sp. NBRC 13810]
MIRSLGKLGDRLLDKLLPTTSAAAETCWTETKYVGYTQWRQCCIAAGRTGCTPWR